MIVQFILNWAIGTALILLAVVLTCVAVGGVAVLFAIVNDLFFRKDNTDQ